MLSSSLSIKTDDLSNYLKKALVFLGLFTGFYLLSGSISDMSEKSDWLGIVANAQEINRESLINMFYIGLASGLGGSAFLLWAMMNRWFAGLDQSMNANEILKSVGRLVILIALFSGVLVGLLRTEWFLSNWNSWLLYLYLITGFSVVISSVRAYALGDVWKHYGDRAVYGFSAWIALIAAIFVLVPLDLMHFALLSASNMETLSQSIQLWLGFLGGFIPVLIILSGVFIYFRSNRALYSVFDDVTRYLNFIVGIWILNYVGQLRGALDFPSLLYLDNFYNTMTLLAYWSILGYLVYKLWRLVAQIHTQGLKDSWILLFKSLMILVFIYTVTAL